MVEKQVSVAVRGGAEVGDGGVLQGTAAAMECDGERARRVVGAQVGGRHEEPSPRHAGSVGARQGFARFAGQRALGPLGDHFDRIDKLFTLQTQLREAFAAGSSLSATFCGVALRSAWRASSRAAVAVIAARNSPRGCRKAVVSSGVGASGSTIAPSRAQLRCESARWRSKSALSRRERGCPPPWGQEAASGRARSSGPGQSFSAYNGESFPASIGRPSARDELTGVAAPRGRGKLGPGPRLAGELVVGADRGAEDVAGGQRFRRVALAVEPHGGSAVPLGSRCWPGAWSPSRLQARPGRWRATAG